jgi:hypothetical protein
MADSNGEKVVHVDFEGHTIVNLNALLRNANVRATMERMSKESERFRGKPGVTFIKPSGQRD